jgi:hypothetical protein
LGISWYWQPILSECVLIMTTYREGVSRLRRPTWQFPSRGAEWWRTRYRKYSRTSGLERATAAPRANVRHFIYLLINYTNITSFMIMQWRPCSSLSTVCTCMHMYILHIYLYIHINVCTELTHLQVAFKTVAKLC